MDTSRGDGVELRRRSVVKGAAWAAPVVSLGVAAPLSAASPPPVAPTLDAGGTCKHSNEPPQSQRYHVAVVWENTLDCETTVTITSITVAPNSGTGVGFTGIPSPFTVSGSGTVSHYYDSLPTPNMANGTATVTYTYTDCGGNGVAETVPLTFSSLPPCQSGITSDWPHDGTSSTYRAEDTESPSSSSTSSSPSSKSSEDQDTTNQKSRTTPAPSTSSKSATSTTPDAPAPTSTTPSN